MFVVFEHHNLGKFMGHPGIQRYCNGEKTSIHGDLSCMYNHI